MHLRALAVGFLVLPMLVASAHAGGPRTFEISITNVTKGQGFTPILVATHDPDLRVFELGAPASPELSTLAESGMTGPLAGLLTDAGATVQELPGPPLEPGDTRTTVIAAGRGETHLFVGAMLIPTNDTFFAVNGVRLPRRRAVLTLSSPGYDAGTEFNDQNCLRIPGPRCMGEGSSAAAMSDEGFIYVGNGFHDLVPDPNEPGEVLGPVIYDWRNQVAHITVKHIKP